MPDLRRGYPSIPDLTPPMRAAFTTAQTLVSAHKTRHQDAGADEISVVGLSGLLADDQHVLDAEVVAASEAYSIKWALILG